MQNGGLKKAKYYFKAYYLPNNKNNEKIKILEEYFIRKNRNKCKIIYKNKIYELKEYFEDIDINYNHKDLIKFKLLFIHNIIDMSFMFYDCDSLVSLSDNNDIYKNISCLQMYVIGTYGMFSGNESLISLPDISKWNTSKIKNMSHMFHECLSLKSLPDISKWDASNVMYMDFMFALCISLISLPDISKWDTSNVIDMDYMFYECNSLISFPDILKWNSSKIYDIVNIFCNCNSLLEVPDFYMLNKYKNCIIFELTYKNDNLGKFKILDEEFVEFNKNKGNIIYNNIDIPLCEYFDEIDNNNRQDLIKIILCLDKSIKYMSGIFHNCNSLISVEYFKINNQSKEKNINDNSIFHNSKDKQYI